MRFFAQVPNINFMAQRKTGLWVSSLLTVAVVLLLAFRGLNFGIDFTGGVLVEVHYQQTVELDNVREALGKGGYERAVVQYFGTSQDVLIRLPPAHDTDQSKVSTAILDALGSEAEGIDLRRVEFVGPQVGQELTEKGGMAMLFAFLGIMAYIAFRFEWKFSVGCVAALVHDVLMTLGFLSLFQVEFDLTTLGGILALIGYSNNETVVIYDRVRENLISLRRASIYEVVNLSINQTLLRSIITHLTTLLVLTALFMLGGASVHSFSVALICGVIVATYSSIYISTGLAILLGIQREDLLPPKEETEKEVV
ncbi:preprotein translocase subunit SecF [Panacagrimonas perspica]|uniref:Protein-export membrane protein SecF n=1 Tax=Panacagrimonas perspica TaxID=381431 RepID=A0A4S3K997_9GAMM|nr:protein translocase subunit SecF [Panacagrimonas perspica]TDU24297.1 preprotein translocase subunit SecF [Panacagrimonas perspica]THD04698.1 protein-export membrane protein SecF [Panacagrimonas perspica]